MRTLIALLKSKKLVLSICSLFHNTVLTHTTWRMIWR